MPFGNPQREKSFRCRSTHFFAQVSIFSFCVGVLKKNANTEVARKRHSKSFCDLRRTLFQHNLSTNGRTKALPYQDSKNFCILRLPRVVGMRRELYWIKDVFLLSLPCSAAIAGRPRRERPG